MSHQGASISRTLTSLQECSQSSESTRGRPTSTPPALVLIVLLQGHSHSL